MAKYFNTCTADDGKSKKVFFYDGKEKFSVPRKAMNKIGKAEFEGVTVSVADKMADIVKAAYKDPAKAASEAAYPAGEWGVYIAEIAAWGGAAVLLMWGYYRRMRALEAKGTPQA
jgi:hypothetical protein